MGSPGIGSVRLCVQLHHKLTRAAAAGVLQTALSSTTAGGHTHPPTSTPRSCLQVLRSQAIGWCVSEPSAVSTCLSTQTLSNSAGGLGVFYHDASNSDQGPGVSWLRSPSLVLSCHESLVRVPLGGRFSMSRSGLLPGSVSLLSCVLSARVVHFIFRHGMPDVETCRLRPTAYNCNVREIPYLAALIGLLPLSI